MIGTCWAIGSWTDYSWKTGSWAFTLLLLMATKARTIFSAILNRDIYAGKLDNVLYARALDKSIYSGKLDETIYAEKLNKDIYSGD
ncbi:MAG: hypothetical protein ABIH34_04325 [Nanoarchaeota archaeon]